MKFSQYAILNEVCLGIAFTAQPFQNHILGLSYTAEIDNEKTFRVSVGGICDKMLKRRPLSNFNALVISGTFQNGNGFKFNILLFFENISENMAQIIKNLINFNCYKHRRSHFSFFFTFLSFVILHTEVSQSVHSFLFRGLF